MATTLLKLGGELLDDASAVRTAAEAIVRLASATPLVVVHGGGRAIDAEIRARGNTPTFVDGLRITDRSGAGCRGLGSGGAHEHHVGRGDRRRGRTRNRPHWCGRANRAVDKDRNLHQVSGQTVDLGLVGQPDGTDASLLADLLRINCIPVIASVGVTREGTLLNVNADTIAAHLAALLRADRLVIAGATAGVLDNAGVRDSRAVARRASIA